MFRSHTILSLALLLALGTSAAASDFVPYQAGDNATFTNTRFGGDVTVAIDRERGNWKRYTEFAGLGPLWVWAHPTAERVYVWSTALGTHQKLVDFDARVGTTTRIDVGLCNAGDVTLAAKDETVSVPAGTFTDCTRLDLRTSCSDAGVTSIYFKAGVGIVRWEQLNITGLVSVDLTAATVGGTTYPVEAGLAVRGVFPAPSATINRMPTIGGPRPAKILNLSLTLENKTGVDLSYRFYGGQRFEISVTDTNGQVAVLWSTGRAFTRDIRTETLADGDSWRFSGAVKLVTATGDPLAPGAYTLRIELTSRGEDGTAHPVGAERVSAESPISIFHAF